MRGSVNIFLRSIRTSNKNGTWVEFAGHPVAGPIALLRIKSHLGGHPELLAAAVAGRDRLLDCRPHGLLVVVEQSLERVEKKIWNSVVNVWSNWMRFQGSFTILRTVSMCLMPALMAARTASTQTWSWRVAVPSPIEGISPLWSEIMISFNKLTVTAG